MKKLLLGTLLIGSISTFASEKFPVLGSMIFQQDCEEVNLMYYDTNITAARFNKEYKTPARHASLMEGLRINNFISKETSSIDFLKMPNGTVGVQQFKCN
jgi:hypothetical protein